MEVTDMHIKLVEKIVKERKGITVRLYCQLFCVSKPTAIKRMRRIAERSSLRIFEGDQRMNPTRLVE